MHLRTQAIRIENERSRLMALLDRSAERLLTLQESIDLMALIGEDALWFGPLPDLTDGDW